VYVHSPRQSTDYFIKVMNIKGKIGKKLQYEEGIGASFSLAGEHEGAWEGPSSRRNLVWLRLVVIGFSCM